MATPANQTLTIRYIDARFSVQRDKYAERWAVVDSSKANVRVAVLADEAEAVLICRRLNERDMLLETANSAKTLLIDIGKTLQSQFAFEQAATFLMILRGFTDLPPKLAAALDEERAKLAEVADQ